MTCISKIPAIRLLRPAWLAWLTAALLSCSKESSQSGDPGENIPRVHRSFTATFDATGDPCNPVETCTINVKAGPDRFESLARGENYRKLRVFEDGKLTVNGQETRTRAALVDILERIRFWQLRDAARYRMTDDRRIICGRDAVRFLRTIADGKTLTFELEYWLDKETNVVLEGHEASKTKDKKDLLATWTCKEIRY